MKFTFDPRCNIAYTALRDKPEQVETVHLSDELKADIAPHGIVSGIELLNAAAPLGQSPVIRDASGRESEIQLPAASSRWAA